MVLEIRKNRLAFFSYHNKVFFETPIDARSVKNENYPNIINLVSLERTQRLEQTLLKHYTPYMKWKRVTRQNRY